MKEICRGCSTEEATEAAVALINSSSFADEFSDCVSG